MMSVRSMIVEHVGDVLYLPPLGCMVNLIILRKEDVRDCELFKRERTCHIVEESLKLVLSDGTELFENGCSECNCYLDYNDNYCPNCGAKVVSE